MENQIDASKLVRVLRENIELKLSELAMPNEIQSYFQKLASVSEDNLPSGISDAEYRFVLALQSNLFHKRQELDWAIGLMLLFSELGPDTPYFWLFETFGDFEKEGKPRAEYNSGFWQGVGDCTVKICSFFDALGGYLAFVFFGLIENPLYFHQVMESLRGKHSWSYKLKQPDRIQLIQEGDPFNLDEFVGWEILWESRNRYQELKIWRNTFIHNFSPMLRTRYFDTHIDWLTYDALVPFLAKLSSLEVKSRLIEHYFFARLARLGAAQIAEGYCKTGSYHRNYYHA